VRRRRSILIPSLLISALVSACSGINTASSPSPISRAPQLPQPLPPSGGSCTASQAQFAVGDRASDDLLERSRTAAGASIARYLRPNQPITLEFLGSRLNLKLDDKDVVTSVSCG
jgi:hypothetical protein